MQIAQNHEITYSYAIKITTNLNSPGSQLHLRATVSMTYMIQQYHLIPLSAQVTCIFSEITNMSQHLKNVSLSLLHDCSM